MKIGVLIPDRNDRPEFLKQCLKMISNQTVQPDFVEVVNFESGFSPDLNFRYRIGVEALKDKGADVIFFIENDDYYSCFYIETMLQNWRINDKPKVFGVGSTIYYHLGLQKYLQMIHKNRASAFSTMITSDLFIDYPQDKGVDFDLKLWGNNIGKTFEPIETICIGIKHGYGLCGGKGHSEKFNYNKTDNKLAFLESIVDKKSFKFYKKWHIKHNSNL